MTREPFDFRAVVAGARCADLVGAHRGRAKQHVETTCGPLNWADLERMHDVYDRRYFTDAGLSAAFDVWDNRRKKGDA